MSNDPAAIVSNPHPLRVFLCHSKADKPAVRELYQRLKADGFEPWLDEEDLLPGQEWELEFHKAFRQSEIAIVCLSMASINTAGYLQKEIRFALDVADKQPEGNIFIIPLRLEECDVPDRLHRWQWVNLFEKNGYERLMRALQHRASSLGIAQPNFTPSTKGSKDEHPSTSALQKTNWLPLTLVLGAIAFIVLIAVLTSKPTTQVSDKDGMTLLYVPAGEFTMGSDSGDAQPVHTVYLDAFWIDQTEVTNAMYAKCVAAGACQAPSSTNSKTHDRYYGNAQFDSYPVVNVSWNDATAYCRWAGRDLPTEAQWEKAARGDDQRTYPWGTETPDANRLNFNRNVGDTTEVGKYPNGASPYGALDMAGNVWEWVVDWYGADYYSGSPSSNPTGPTSGDKRVLRGGSWDNDASVVRASVRLGFTPDHGGDSFGFRCAR